LQDDGTILLTDEQARAILDLRLQKLTALGMEEITDEAEKLAAKITDLLAILRSRDRVRDIIRDELTEVREKFATPRRSVFMDGGFDFDDEDLIAVSDMVVTVTNGGYVKRTPLDTYRAQHRGGKGRSGMQTKDEDFVTTVFVATTHTPILLFSSSGMAYKLKVWKLPQGGAATRGRSFNQLIPSLEKDEFITSIMALPENEEDWAGLDIMFASKSGGVRRNSLADFTRVNRNGKIAMKPDEGDGIVDVRVCSEDDDILLTTALGQTIRFPVLKVRRFNSRNSTGVRGIRLADDDEVISMAVLHHDESDTAKRNAYIRRSNQERRALGDSVDDAADDTDDADNDVLMDDATYGAMGAKEQFVLTVATDGLGKRTSSYHYATKGRGGKGLIAQNLERGDDEPNAKLVRSFVVGDDDQIMLVTDGGQLMRTPVRSISISSRSAKGVWVIRTREDERVVSVERIADTEDDESDGSEAPQETKGDAPEE
jgi:DNA gyrase subunit A